MSDNMEMEAGRMPLLGQKLPQMTVNTTHGTFDLTEHFAGKWFVLFSHPGDFTPVCTTEFYAFSKLHEKFREVNAELIGHSVDQVFSHIKWIEWIEDNLDTKIDFPVIADDRGKVAEKLGMLHPAMGSNTVRAVFIVDPNGVLRLVLYYPQEVGRNMDEILRALKALQKHEEMKVALPANWPNNELLKDRVIVPPATDVETANQRRGTEDCYDWWFCHKEAK
jgi:peroxiredoxin (alkyl hydroperoxide reductase subunit C)